MSLRVKVILILLGVFAAYGLLDYGVQRLLIYPSFVQLELQQATREVDRAIEALEREIDGLLPTASDWATWDDTYRFVQDHNRAYIDANLNLETLAGLRLSLMAFYDADGRLAWGAGRDPNTGEAIALPELTAATLPRDHVLLSGRDPSGVTAGLLASGQGAMLLVAKSILKSDATGPSAGTLIVGRLLDQRAVRRIAGQAGVNLYVTLVAGQQWKAAPPQFVGGALRHTPVTLREGKEAIIGSTIVADLLGRPLLRVEVATARDITARGDAALNFSWISLAGAGIVVLAVLLALLDRTVFEPVQHLKHHVSALGDRDDLEARLDMQRSDEIGVLAREFDRMVGHLAEARSRLLEQSYNSGVAEMASCVLHNVGNAVTPINVQLTDLLQGFRQAPAAELDMAVAELADPATPAERRAELSRFVELAGRELATVVQDAPRALDAVARQLRHVQQILANQEQYSRAARVLEPIVLDALVAEVLANLPDATRSAMRVEIDPSLRRVGKVVAAPAALRQVVRNLLINAAESIRAAGLGARAGRVRLLGSTETLDGASVAHLCVQDNGAGIDPADLPRLFERGFTTKAGGAGMGLHWSATTLASMQGRMYAESQGPGTGACVHLLIPLAKLEAERAA
jgi:sensor domain CHASE-containing protein